MALLVLAGCGAKEGLQANGSMETNVIRVVDGDTFEMEGGERVRLIGVDTPESVKPNTPVQPYAKEASSYTKQLLEGKKVRLQFDVQLRDKYKRLLAYVYLPDGTFVNRKLIEEGYAKTLTIPPNVAFSEQFAAAMKQAREEKRGLWADDTSKKNVNSAGKPSSTKKNATDQGANGEKRIKGNITRNGEKIYHTPDSPSYEQTKAEVWFSTEEEARAAGFRAPKRYGIEKRK
ncbi:thermonuclease family protein [Brevibacillus migulae]|uniref:thermonuclease family protein n=1 Tax=Brevibacillus migulae TaxID=1644114 RepID=UPI001F312C5F|nr:thermonuclease family protein [Brevibacillus migulae]